MFAKLMPAMFVLACAGSVVSLSACGSSNRADQYGSESECASREETSTQTAASRDTADWPADAVPGECYAKAYIPPALRTVKQQVLKREATEQIEIVPARYEWVDERVMTKEPSCSLAELPAEFKTEQVTVEVRPAETGWLVNSGGCHTTDGRTVNNVYCYVTRPAETKTVSKQVMCKPARVERIEVPAEYQTIRRQKLVAAATTRKTCIPAEYETVEKTVVAAPAHWEWQRVVCDHSPETMNKVKQALMASGYPAGPMNGEMTAQDWASIEKFQLDHGLGVGNLSHETMKKLQVSLTR
jgi:hypothetical protein